MSDQVGGERFEASEALFQPHLINKEGQGNDEMMIKCDQSEQLWSTKSEEVRVEFESLPFNREGIQAVLGRGVVVLILCVKWSNHFALMLWFQKDCWKLTPFPSSTKEAVSYYKYFAQVWPSWSSLQSRRETSTWGRNFTNTLVRLFLWQSYFYF